MFAKKRAKPPDLSMWKCLDARMTLDTEDRKYMLQLQKGYEGEKVLDEWLAMLPNSYLVLNDLLLAMNQNVLQLDSVVLAGSKAILFEVKNYEGDYYIEEDQWYSASGTEIRNPLHQLKRSQALLEKFLQKERLSFSVQAYLVFVDPQFVLLQAPRHAPILYPGQLPRFFERLQQSTFATGHVQQQLAERLISSHLPESPYRRKPTYTYEELQKGICCNVCSAFLRLGKNRYLHCSICKTDITVEAGILQNTKEFQLLFPEKKMTTAEIYEWSGRLIKMRKIRDILKKHFVLNGHGKYTYYVDPASQDHSYPVL